jgi:hypothetical protein
MSSRSVTDLVALPVVAKPGATHSGYQRAGSHDRPQVQVPEKLELFVLRHILRHYAPSLLTPGWQRFAVIQGPPEKARQRACGSPVRGTVSI